MTLSLAERAYHACFLTGTFRLRSGQISKGCLDLRLAGAVVDTVVCAT